MKRNYSILVKKGETDCLLIEAKRQSGELQIPRFLQDTVLQFWEMEKENVL